MPSGQLNWPLPDPLDPYACSNAPLLRLNLSMRSLPQSEAHTWSSPKLLATPETPWNWPAPLPYEPTLLTKPPVELYSSRRLSCQSATQMFPEESVARSVGSRSWPAPVPNEPN